MNRHLRPFGLKLGPLQAGAVYFPIHFLAVGIGLTALIAPQGVGVFWPSAGSLFAFLLLYPARYWRALFITSYVAELLAHTVFAPQLPFSGAGLLFPVKFAAALLGVAIMHVCVRGPISFARLRHVLVFTAAALVSSLAVRDRATALRGDPAFGEHAYWMAVQSWSIGDFLGTLIVTPLVLTVGFHGFALKTHSRGGRAATLSAFGVLMVLLLAVFLRKPWRAPVTAGCSLHRLSGAGLDRDDQRRATHRARRGHHRRHSLACHHARVRTLRQPVPAADFSRAVRLAGAAVAGGDGRT